MEKEVLHALLGLAQIGVEPVAQICAAQERTQQRHIAVMRGIAAPCKESVGPRCQAGDEQETAQPAEAAARQSHEQRDKNSNGSSNDDDATPLLEKAAPAKWALDQNAVAHDRVADQQNNQSQRADSNDIQQYETGGNGIERGCRRDRRKEARTLQKLEPVCH